MDATGADFMMSVNSLQDRLGVKGYAIQLPIGTEDQFRGIIDLVGRKTYYYNDDEINGLTIVDGFDVAELADEAELLRSELIDNVVEYDEDVMMKYLDGEEITEEELKSCIRKGVATATFFPVVGGSAYKNKGVLLLLDAVIDYLPAPTDIAAIKGELEDGTMVERHADDNEPFSALAFKIMTDPFVGKLTFFRVYSGKVESGSYVMNSSKGKRERVGRILQMHANSREEISEVYSGDIAAAVGLKDTVTGDTLCDMKDQVILEKMVFPEPVIEVAVEPKTKADQDKMGLGLSKLAEEDPSFRAKTDPETGQTIIAGMGELHLDIIVDRLKREFSVETTVGAPQVAYRETFTVAGQVEHKYAKQSGGRGQYGHVVLDIEPLEAGSGFEFVDKIVGGTVPREYIPVVGTGLEDAALNGVLAGYPLIDFRASLVFGSYHDVDSSEMAYKIAASMALRDAATVCQAVILEPIMKVEVVIPEEYMGDVMGELTSRRGRVEGMEQKGNAKEIHSFVPLSEMFGYATSLRSNTQGRGVFTMTFDHYEPVPKMISEAIIAKNGKK